MKKIYFQKIVVLFFLLISLPAMAQEEESNSDETTKDETTIAAEKKYKAKLTYFPYVAFAPETSAEFGAFALRQFKPKNAGENTRPSFVQFWSSYTLNKQFNIGLKHALLLPDEKWFFKGYINFKKFPEKFYGIGDNMPQSNEEFVDWTAFVIEQQFMKNIGDKMFAGVQFRYNNMFKVSFDDEEKQDRDFIQEGIYGAEGGASSALGLIYRWDKRDNVLTPSKGFLLEFSTYFYNKIFASDFNFSTISLDARKYFDFSSEKNGNSVLALQARTVSSLGDEIPFREVALFGGKELMRGFYQGRYRDNHSVAFQTEYRQYLFWKLGATVFVGTGNVMNDLSDFDMSRFKVAGGAGLRLNINKNDRTNLRVDYGIGSGGASGLYMTFGEAF